ncbi:MAG: hypothetical protein L6R37_007605 [Teloschistes peruensis]|nr:MAG: hypothetical protein L6R37_007605 [Teloschistes peruensis]
MAPPENPHRALTWRRVSLLGLLLGLVSLIWLLYPSQSPQLQVLHKVPALSECPDGPTVHNVAIIGAGSAGSSAAYYLNEFQSSCHRANITVYERNDYVGGRSTTVSVYDDPNEPVELGASIFVKVNRNLVNAAEKFDLPVQSMGSSRKIDIPEVLGVWDGDSFVFKQSDATNSYWNLAKLFWKYGLSPLTTQNLMKKTVGSFLKMYEEPHFPFASLTEAASDLDLLSATGATGKQFLAANGVNEKFAHDIIQASTRVNYAQNLDQIHGLETMVCMAIEGAMSIQGGNWQIFDGMIKTSGANLLLNTTVTSITKTPETEKYTVKSTAAPVIDPAQDISITTTTEDNVYDTIILAAPLQFASLDFHPPLPSPPPAIPYVSLHVTLFTSPYPLSRTFFNITDGRSAEEMPTTILTTTPPPPNPNSNTKKQSDFFSISTLRTVSRRHHPSSSPSPHSPPSSPNQEQEQQNTTTEYLYKIFSPTHLSPEWLNRILDDTPRFRFPVSFPNSPKPPSTTSSKISWTHTKIWDSYPYLPPRRLFDAILLDSDSDSGRGGVWYTAGIETFVSTMETSSLMGMDVAGLVSRTWGEGVGGKEMGREGEEL